jgi:hypothetical protein
MLVPRFPLRPKPERDLRPTVQTIRKRVPVPLPLSLLSTTVDEILANPGRGAGEAFAGVEDDEPVGVNTVSAEDTCWVPAGRVMNPLEESSKFCC